jgi:hypothetical protein
MGMQAKAASDGGRARDARFLGPTSLDDAAIALNRRHKRGVLARAVRVGAREPECALAEKAYARTLGTSGECARRAIALFL